MWGLAKLANEQKEDKASVWPALGLAGLGLGAYGLYRALKPNQEG